MFEKLNTIELSGKCYPIRCDILVLEKIQEEYGSIDDFESKLMTWEPELDEDGKEIKKEDGKVKYHGKLPDVKALNDALYWMVSEGEAVAAEEEGRKPEAISREGLARKADLTPIELANRLHNEFYKCFESKNAKATQRMRNQEEAGQ